MSLLNELKRRNVFRVGLAYLVTAWVIAQVASLILNSIKAPDWVMQSLLLLLGLGFIAALIIAWAYELTPEGIKKEKDVLRDESITNITAKKLDYITLAAAFVVIALFGYQQMYPVGQNEITQQLDSESDIQASEGKSIAVLPFADMSVQGDQAYFADGISEELLNVLAQVDGLKVAARTSSFKFRGDEHDIVEIGNALKVKTVLEGSVRKSGNQIRITAQLIDVAGGFHIWSETYDRELDNIFALQDEIALSIVEALKLKLQLHSDKGGIQHAESGEAYDLYLRGRELAREPSKEGLTRALKFFNQALLVDPDLASAHGAIASAWIWLEDYGGVPTQDAFDRAEPAAKRALELEPERADALTAMGLLEARKYDNIIAARDYFERALKANPAFIDTYHLYADILGELGEYQKALKVRRDSVERDPLSSFLKSRLASQLGDMGQFDEAERLLNEIFADNPNDAYAYEEQAGMYWNNGNLARALPAFKFVHENRPGDPFAAHHLAIGYSLMQMPEKAQEWIAAARARGVNNRWELTARGFVARTTGDWDALFRVGQLHLAKNGSSWQGLASLGKQDWEIARASFQRNHSRLNYRQGDEANLDVLASLAGLALAEKRLGLSSWSVHSDAAKNYSIERIKTEASYSTSILLYQTLAQIAAIEGDVDLVVKHMQSASDKHFLEHTFLEHDPFFAELREEPRLIAIADQMREHVIAERKKLEQVQ